MQCAPGGATCQSGQYIHVICDSGLLLALYDNMNIFKHSEAYV